MLASRLIGHKSKPRPLWRQVLMIIVVNRWGSLAFLITILILALYFSQTLLVEEWYLSVRNQVIRALGFGSIPATIWAILALVIGRLYPRWIIRKWRGWIASWLLLVAVQTVLGGIYGADGIVAESTLGGRVGQALWGTSPIQGILIAAGLTVFARAMLWPWSTYRDTKLLIRGFVRLLQGSLHLLGRLAWWIAKSIVRRAQTTLRRKSKPTFEAEVVQETVIQNDSSVEAHLQPTRMVQRFANYKEFVEQPMALRRYDTLPEKTPSPPGNKWALPSMDFLESGTTASVTEEETTQVAQKIEETLGHHGVQVSVVQIKPGPTVTLYGLNPGWVRRNRNVKELDGDGNIVRDSSGKPVITNQEVRMRVKVDSILAREKDLALALAAPSLRIQAPVPGESVVGIEVPNSSPVLVTLRSVMETPEFQDAVEVGGLSLPLGQGSGGDPVTTDLRQLPHLLIAGATGSGKSVCINALIVSLVSQVSPEQLRLLLIDPKRVELTPFNGLPHLVAPVVVDTAPAVKALKGMLREMFRRYKRLEDLGVRNIDGYHRHPKALEAMPYLVIAIDELADLMMSAPYDIEQTLCRLAQLGRATGIHLIVATQRPSVDVVTGLIKANFPSRISFAVVSQVDSRTILDSAGADRLLGKGDLLFLSGETPKPQRVQGAFVSDREIERLMEFWKYQHGPPLPQFDLEPEPEESQDGTRVGAEQAASQDEMLEKAIELANLYSRVSTSLLQRRLRIGYPRAARLMDQLDDMGFLGPGEPGKPREVIRKIE